MRYFYLSTMLMFSISGFSQQYAVYQPDAAAGKDAYFKSSTPSLNQGTHPDVTALAWTNNGQPTTTRSVIQFDLSNIPQGSIILSAYLTLYNNPTSPNNDGFHSTLDGPNAMRIRRITSPWDEFTITWNNQPTTTSENQVLTEPTIDNSQNLENIDVTALVQDMVDHPESSFGFGFALQNESLYRGVVCASSDNANRDLHPKLVVTFDATNSVFDSLSGKIRLNVYPNPSDGNFFVVTPTALTGYNIFNVGGQLLKNVNFSIPSNSHFEIDLSDLSNGVYFLHPTSQDVTQQVAVSRILKK